MKATILKYKNDICEGQFTIKHNQAKGDHNKILSRIMKKFKKKDNFTFTSEVIDIEEPTEELVES